MTMKATSFSLGKCRRSRRRSTPSSSTSPASSLSRGESFIAVVEVCGFNDWLIRMLRDYRCHQVILIQPEERKRRKTDRRDAAALSELLWVNRDSFSARQAGPRAQAGRHRLDLRPRDATADHIAQRRRQGDGLALSIKSDTSSGVTTCSGKCQPRGFRPSRQSPG